jgi:hypothetical protein
LGLKLDNTGGAIALMTWLYWTGVALLLGAELNCELAKVSAQGKIEEKHEPPPITKIDFALARSIALSAVQAASRVCQACASRKCHRWLGA